MFATLLTQIRAITASTTTETADAEIVDYIKAGVRYVLTTLPLQLSFPFAISSSSVTSAAAIVTDTTKVIKVKRNSIDCSMVPQDMSYEIGDANSIHLATARFPAFYIEGANIWIKPDPTTAASAHAVIVDIPAKVTAMTTTSITAVGQYDNIVIKYGAHLDAYQKAAFFGGKGTSKLATITASITSALDAFVTALPSYTTLSFTFSEAVITDALTKAEQLIDTLSTKNVETYLGDDDPEMVQVTVAAAQQEVNRARAAIDNEQAQIADTDMHIKQRLQAFKSNLVKAMSYLQRASIKVQEGQMATYYNQQSQTYVALGQTLLKECMTEMNNYIGQQNDTTASDGEGRQ